MAGNDLVKRNPGELAPVGGTIIVSAAEAVEVRSSWLELKQAELERMLEARSALQAIGGHERRISRVTERIQLTRKVIAALQSGYVPIPRFDAAPLNPDVDVLPTRVLMAYAVAQNEHLFDEVRLVQGRESRNPGNQQARRTGRDPLLVGIVRTKEHRFIDALGWERRVPAREEHFLIAWWRPEDDRDEDLF